MLKTKKKCIAAISLTTLLLSCNTSKKQEEEIGQDKKTADKPNFIFIMADDLGYGDLGCYGQEKIQTPNIDKMSREGTRFTQFYSGSTVCAPSRCALMTGKHMGHAYIRGNSREPIPSEEITLAEIMKDQGYVTGMYGKWGLGLTGSSGDPDVQGFDEFTGYNHQGEAHFYYTDTIDKIVDGNTVRFPIDSTKYTHEIFAEDALNFIKKYKDTTFFLYLPFCIPHAELLVPQKDLEQYLDEDGNSIFEETPHPGGHYRKQDRPRAAYAAMVSKLDRDVGRVLDLLKEHGLDENTYVFFTSDNGPHTAGGHDFRYFDGNGPLRGFKRDLYEGGIRVPMIAWAPGKVPQGNVSDVVWAFWDVVPTFSDMIGAKPPRENDGMSFKQTIHGELQNQLHAYLYWEHCVGWSKEPKKLSQAIRAGEWKLLKIKKPGQETSYELYNLYNDFSEENNLFNQEKEKAGELLKLIDEVCEKPQSDAFYDFTRFE